MAGQNQNNVQHTQGIWNNPINIAVVLIQLMHDHVGGTDCIRINFKLALNKPCWWFICIVAVLAKWFVMYDPHLIIELQPLSILSAWLSHTKRETPQDASQIKQILSLMRQGRANFVWKGIGPKNRLLAMEASAWFPSKHWKKMD